MIGATALWLMYAWLLCAIVASYLSNRKGYGEKVGLAFGLLLHVVGVIVWLAWPAKEGSKWKTLGPVGRRRAEDVAPRAAAAADE
jgi:fucose permease